MGVSGRTLSYWEAGATPLSASYPQIIGFLGYEPWPEPATTAQRLRCGRLRRGLTIREAAVELGVDDTTVWWWEGGRKPHLKAHWERINSFVGDAPSEAAVTVPEGYDMLVTELLTIGRRLRARRAELGLTQVVAAAQIGSNAWTYMLWELDRRSPTDRFYPALIHYLGCEPWPAPTSVAARLRAARLRRGLTKEQAAAVMQVDPGSVSLWESGRGPQHAFHRSAVEAFITEGVRPRKKAKRR